jgi:hypothetical protein
MSNPLVLDFNPLGIGVYDKKLEWILIVNTNNAPNHLKNNCNVTEVGVGAIQLLKLLSFNYQPLGMFQITYQQSRSSSEHSCIENKYT